MDDSMFTIQEMYANLLTAYGKACLRIRQLEAAVAALSEYLDSEWREGESAKIVEEAMQNVE